MSCSSQKPDCGSYQTLTCCIDKRTHKQKIRPASKHWLSLKWKMSLSGTVEDPKNSRFLQGRVTNAGSVYLFMVKGWRAGCCLGIQMILGELWLGLPSPELPILLVLPLIPMPWLTWEWFSMFLVFIGNVPLLKHQQVGFSGFKCVNCVISISKYHLLF